MTQVETFREDSSLQLPSDDSVSMLAGREIWGKLYRAQGVIS